MLGVTLSASIWFFCVVFSVPHSFTEFIPSSTTSWEDAKFILQWVQNFHFSHQASISVYGSLEFYSKGDWGFALYTLVVAQLIWAWMSFPSPEMAHLCPCSLCKRSFIISTGGSGSCLVFRKRFPNVTHWVTTAHFSFSGGGGDVSWQEAHWVAHADMSLMLRRTEAGFSPRPSFRLKPYLKTPSRCTAITKHVLHCLPARERVTQIHAHMEASQTGGSVSWHWSQWEEEEIGTLRSVDVHNPT